ncbi:MAG: caspase family protein, partial [Schlesneria sp.]
MFRLVITSVCLLMSFTAAAGEKHALLIGVNKYDDSLMSPLQFPENDAKALGDVLKNSGYEVDLLLGKAATAEAIRAKFRTFRTLGTSEGVLIVGLFGHGVETPSIDVATGKQLVDDQRNTITEGCFCPFDTVVIEVKDSTTGQTRFGNSGEPLTEPKPDSLVRLSELLSSLKLAKCGHRVVFADCCRNIPNEARGRSFGASFRAKDLPDNASVLFGCSPRERSFEHTEWGHGAFTKCLIDLLAEL